jgi:hypothetical protein
MLDLESELSRSHFVLRMLTGPKKMDQLCNIGGVFGLCNLPALKYPDSMDLCFDYKT